MSLGKLSFKSLLSVVHSADSLWEAILPHFLIMCIPLIVDSYQVVMLLVKMLYPEAE